MMPGDVLEFRVRSVEKQVESLWSKKADNDDVVRLRTQVNGLCEAVDRLRNVILGAAVTVGTSALLVAATAIYLGGP